MIASGRTYDGIQPVPVRVRERSGRYVVDDDGAAVEAAGKPQGWLKVAERVVEEDALNVNRRGVVFVPTPNAEKIPELVDRVAATSVAVYEALLELDDE